MHLGDSNPVYNMYKSTIWPNVHKTHKCIFTLLAAHLEYLNVTVVISHVNNFRNPQYHQPHTVLQPK